MSVPLAPQAQEILGKSDVVMITERVDDVALLIGPMVTMGLPEVLDRPLPRHGTQRGLRWGWTAVMWLASIVTEGEHRTVSGDTSRKGMHHPLSPWTAQGVDPLDCRDDRWSPLRTHVSKPSSWHQIDHDVNARRIAVDALPQDVIRCDATTVSGDHAGPAGGLGQCGQRNDDPTRPQSNVMRGSLDPVGRPRSTEVVSGERAEEGVDLPSMARIRAGVKTPGLLFGGACTRRAVETRAYLARHHDGSVSPCPWTGATAEARAAWSTAGVTQGEAGQ